MELIKKPTSKFIRVKCGKCKNEQVIFNKPATEVKCLVCETVLMASTGGKGKALAKVVQIIE